MVDQQTMVIRLPAAVARAVYMIGEAPPTNVGVGEVHEPEPAPEGETSDAPWYADPRTCAAYREWNAERIAMREAGLKVDDQEDFDVDKYDPRDFDLDHRAIREVEEWANGLPHDDNPERIRGLSDEDYDEYARRLGELNVYRRRGNRKPRLHPEVSTEAVEKWVRWLLEPGNEP